MKKDIFLPAFTVSAEEIFANKVPMFSINFFNGEDGDEYEKEEQKDPNLLKRLSNNIYDTKNGDPISRFPAFDKIEDCDEQISINIGEPQYSYVLEIIDTLNQKDANINLANNAYHISVTSTNNYEYWSGDDYRRTSYPGYCGTLIINKTITIKTENGEEVVEAYFYQENHRKEVLGYTEDDIDVLALEEIKIYKTDTTKSKQYLGMLSYSYDEYDTKDSWSYSYFPAFDKIPDCQKQISPSMGEPLYGYVEKIIDILNENGANIKLKERYIRYYCYFVRQL